MHEDELETDAGLVRRLLAAQFPHWADLHVERVASSGTVNALYRLGDELVVRLPRMEWGAGAVERDEAWLPRLAPQLPVEVPVPLARGRPGEGYPWDWGVYPWLDGEHPSTATPPSTDDVVAFLLALRGVETGGAPRAHRGSPLAVQDEEARVALAHVEGLVDVGAATRAWQAALAVPPWQGPPVWLHGDLLPGNLLLRGGRLRGVLDWGAAGVGDPACDLIVAWSVLPASERRAFRAALRVDDASWERGRGWALSIGLIALPYYLETNPHLARVAAHLIAEVLAE